LGFASNGIDIIAEVSNFSPYYSNYGRLVTCQIIKKTDGTLLTLYARDNDFTVSITDSDEKIIFYKEIPFELPIFGAFFDGKEYNFAIFGQFNPDENDDVEVYRLVKYDKDWNRLDHLSIYGDTRNSAEFRVKYYT